MADDDDDNDDDGEFRRVIIWINLKTLLPIAKDESDNKLYAFLPQSDIMPFNVSTPNSDHDVRNS